MATLSENLTRIKNATDDIRNTLGMPDAVIEDVATGVVGLNDENIAQAEEIADLEQQIEELTPQGTFTITSNGTFNISGYQYVSVEVEGSQTYNYTIYVYDENGDLIDSPDLDIYDTWTGEDSPDNPRTITDIDGGAEVTVTISYPGYETEEGMRVINADATWDVYLTPEEPETVHVAIEFNDEPRALAFEDNDTGESYNYEQTSALTFELDVVPMSSLHVTAACDGYRDIDTILEIGNNNLEETLDFESIGDVPDPENGQVRVYVRLINSSVEPVAANDINDIEFSYSSSNVNGGQVVHPVGVLEDNLGFKYAFNLQANQYGYFGILNDNMSSWTVFNAEENYPNYSYYNGYPNNSVVYIFLREDYNLSIIDDQQDDDEYKLEITNIKKWSYCDGLNRNAPACYYYVLETNNINNIESNNVYKMAYFYDDEDNLLTGYEDGYCLDFGNNGEGQFSTEFGGEEQFNNISKVEIHSTRTLYTNNDIINESEWVNMDNEDTENIPVGYIFNNNLYLENMNLCNWEAVPLTGVNMYVVYSDETMDAMLEDEYIEPYGSLYPVEHWNVPFALDENKEFSHILISGGEPEEVEIHLSNFTNNQTWDINDGHEESTGIVESIVDLYKRTIIDIMDNGIMPGMFVTLYDDGMDEQLSFASVQPVGFADGCVGLRLDQDGADATTEIFYFKISGEEIVQLIRSEEMIDIPVLFVNNIEESVDDYAEGNCLSWSQGLSEPNINKVRSVIEQEISEQIILASFAITYNDVTDENALALYGTYSGMLTSIDGATAIFRDNEEDPYIECQISIDANYNLEISNIQE